MPDHVEDIVIDAKWKTGLATDLVILPIHVWPDRLTDRNLFGTKIEHERPQAEGQAHLLTRRPAHTDSDIIWPFGGLMIDLFTMPPFFFLLSRSQIHSKGAFNQFSQLPQI